MWTAKIILQMCRLVCFALFLKIIALLFLLFYRSLCTVRGKFGSKGSPCEFCFIYAIHFGSTYPFVHVSWKKQCQRFRPYWRLNIFGIIGNFCYVKLGPNTKTAYWQNCCCISKLELKNIRVKFQVFPYHIP